MDLVRRIYPAAPAVFIDTGLEYPEIRAFALSQENVIRIKPDMNFKEVIQHYGYPVISKEQSAFIHEYRTTNSEKLRNTRWNGNKYGRGKISKKWRYMVDAPFEISDMCCDVMKKHPAEKYEGKSGQKPIIATMACESQLRKSKWLRQGCNAFDSKRPMSNPMSFWTGQDVLEYIRRYNIPYCSVYGDILESPDGKLYTTGCDRTGCVFCANGVHLQKEPNKFQMLKKTHPALWDYCMRDQADGGLGMREVLEAINVPIE